MLPVFLALLGLVSILAGVALIYPPLALIVGGVAALRVAAYVEGRRSADVEGGSP